MARTVKHKIMECKNCEYFYSTENTCFLNNDVCYKNGKCEHIGCKHFISAWAVNIVVNEGYADEIALMSAT